MKKSFLLWWELRKEKYYRTFVFSFFGWNFLNVLVFGVHFDKNNAVSCIKTDPGCLLLLIHQNKIQLIDTCTNLTLHLFLEIFVESCDEGVHTLNQILIENLKRKGQFLSFWIIWLKMVIGIYLWGCIYIFGYCLTWSILFFSDSWLMSHICLVLISLCLFHLDICMWKNKKYVKNVQVSGTIRNCCFEADNQLQNLLSVAEFLWPALLLPVAGNKVDVKPRLLMIYGSHVEAEPSFKLSFHVMVFQSSKYLYAEFLLSRVAALALAG